MALVLIVDDDLHTRQLYVSLLTPFGHQVLEAGDGKEGLEQARSRKPDLIISDVLMPTMNGYEFVTSLRECPGFETIPVIFQSASFLDHETRSLGVTCGVSLVIPKPCDPEIALGIVHRALGTEVAVPTTQQGKFEKLEAIPVLVNAFFLKGKELDMVSARLAALLELGLELARPCDVPALLWKAARGAREIVSANYAAVGILKEDGVRLEWFTIIGMDPETVEKIGKPEFGGAIFRAMTSERKPQRAFSPRGELDNLGLPMCHPPVNSFLVAPLQVGDRLYGWMYAAQKLSGTEFGDEDERVMMALAAQTGLAYENSLGLLAIQDHAAKLEAEIEQKKRAENRLRMLIETAPMGIVIADKSGRITEVNAQALGMFGYEREELCGQSVESLLPDRLRAPPRPLRQGFACAADGGGNGDVRATEGRNRISGGNQPGAPRDE